MNLGIESCFSGDGSYGRGDFGQCPLKLKENQDACSITEVAILEINEANKIRELCRALFRNSGKPGEKDLETKPEIEKNVGLLKKYKM